jgi:subtilisin family serine protease
MRPKLIFTLLTVFLFTYWTGASGTDGSKGGSFQWQDKVDPVVLDVVQMGKTEFLVILNTQADLNQAAALKTKGEKGSFVFETLTQTANSTQKPIRDLLDTLKVEYRAFWVMNMFWVYGDTNTLQQVSQLEEVAQIVANPKIAFTDPQFEVSSTENRCLNPQLEWNIQKINAPKVWSLGYTGQGIVIGGQDTGYEWDHPGLIETYRGWNGASVDHNYNWHNGVTLNGGSCDVEPCDDHGHGTHTMGIMVGDEGGNYQIGVAPGAQWIGCRNMVGGVGSPASYAECYEWFIAPTDLNGANPENLAIIPTFCFQLSSLSEQQESSLFIQQGTRDHLAKRLTNPQQFTKNHSPLVQRTEMISSQFSAVVDP